MQCLKCKTEMITANLSGDAVGIPIYLSKKKETFLGGEKRTSVSCYVCPECGYIELNADKPKDLIL